MIPLPDRRLTSLLVRRNGKMILVDCGEGTQVGVRLAEWGFKAIDAICLTHYHADHVAGLPGFLLTLGNSGRTEPLTILGPPPLEYLLRSLTVICPQLPYEIVMMELPNHSESRLELGEFLIQALPMEHMIPCLAYRFEIKRAGKFDIEEALRHRIPKKFWSILQKGSSVEADGRSFTPEMVLGTPRKGLKVSYCTDSRPTTELIEFCRDSDLLILEGMYGDEDMLQKAVERKHMTFSEAARIALQSNSRELWLTHFSPSLSAPEAYLQNAKDIFPETIIGADLMKKQLSFNR